MNLPMTGWLFTDTRNHTTCPRCNAKPAEQCKQPSGRKTKYPHTERVKAFQPYDPKVYQV